MILLDQHQTPHPIVKGCTSDASRRSPTSGVWPQLECRPRKAECVAACANTSGATGLAGTDTTSRGAPADPAQITYIKTNAVPRISLVCHGVCAKAWGTKAMFRLQQRVSNAVAAGRAPSIWPLLQSYSCHSFLRIMRWIAE